MSNLTRMETRCPNPSCGHAHSIKPDYLGKAATCQICGQRFVVTAGVGTAITNPIHPAPEPASSPTMESDDPQTLTTGDRRVLTIVFSCVGVVFLALGAWVYFTTSSRSQEPISANGSLAAAASAKSRISPMTDLAQAVSFEGSTWRGKLESATKVQSVPQGFNQIDGWIAKEDSTLVVVRGVLEARQPTPNDGWSGDAGQILKRDGATLVDTRIATLDSRSGFHEMLGFITQETSVSGNTWVRCFAATTAPEAPFKVAMVFTAPKEAMDATILFAGGGSAQIQLSDTASSSTKPEAAQGDRLASNKMDSNITNTRIADVGVVSADDVERELAALGFDIPKWGTRSTFVFGEGAVEGMMSAGYIPKPIGPPQNELGNSRVQYHYPCKNDRTGAVIDATIEHGRFLYFADTTNPASTEAMDALLQALGVDMRAKRAERATVSTGNSSVMEFTWKNLKLYLTPKGTILSSLELPTLFDSEAGSVYGIREDYRVTELEVDRILEELGFSYSQSYYIEAPGLPLPQLCREYAKGTIRISHLIEEPGSRYRLWVGSDGRAREALAAATNLMAKELAEACRQALREFENTGTLSERRLGGVRIGVDSKEFAIESDPAPKRSLENAESTTRSALDRLLSDIRADAEPGEGRLFSLSEALSILESKRNSAELKDLKAIGVITSSKWLTRSVLTDRYGVPDSAEVDGDYDLFTYDWLTLIFDKKEKLTGIMLRGGRSGGITTMAHPNKSATQHLK